MYVGVLIWCMDDEHQCFEVYFKFLHVFDEPFVISEAFLIFCFVALELLQKEIRLPKAMTRLSKSYYLAVSSG